MSNAKQFGKKETARKRKGVSPGASSPGRKRACQTSLTHEHARRRKSNLTLKRGNGECRTRKIIDSREKCAQKTDANPPKLCENVSKSRQLGKKETERGRQGASPGTSSRGRKHEFQTSLAREHASNRWRNLTLKRGNGDAQRKISLIRSKHARRKRTQIPQHYAKISAKQKQFGRKETARHGQGVSPQASSRGRKRAGQTSVARKHTRTRQRFGF